MRTAKKSVSPIAPALTNFLPKGPREFFKRMTAMRMETLTLQWLQMWAVVGILILEDRQGVISEDDGECNVRHRCIILRYLLQIALIF